MKNTQGNHSDHQPYICPNCSSYLRSTDSYCPNCGQKRMEKDDFSFRHLFGESFLDYFHIDSTFAKSLVPLVLKPGYLTVEYLKGKRASYVQPFKMFLVASLIYFLLGSFEMPQLLKQKGPNEKKKDTAWINNSEKATHKPGDLKLTLLEKEELLEPEDTLRMKIRKYGIDVYVRYKYPTAGAFSRYLIKKVLRITLSEESFYETMRHTSSRLIFLLIPVAALLFKLLYLRRKRFYYEHLIFSLHFHTFVFLLFIVFQLAAILYQVPMILQLMCILIYLFIAMKKVYSQSIIKTLGKLFLFFFLYLIIAFPVFLILLTGVSLATY